MASTPTTVRRAVAADVDPGDNWGVFYVNDVPNTIDIAALGANVTGAVGDTVAVTVGLRNDGPAMLDTRSPATPPST